MNIFKQKLKKNNNKKGFTLVEIIVVLVILAVLAAAAIPTMLGFVEDAKGKAEIANARAAYIACQSIATEEFASGSSTKSLTNDVEYTIDSTKTTKLDTMLGKDMNGAKITPTIDANGKVTKMVYTTTKYKVTITPNEAAVVEKVTETKKG